MNTQDNNYKPLINKIRRKRRLVTFIAFAVLFVIIFICSPASFVVFDKTVFSSDGVSTGVTIALILLVMFIELIAHGAVLMPLTSSMDNECDPEKYIALNDALGKGKNKAHALCVGYFYTGNFSVSLDYIKEIVNQNNISAKTLGLFYKARCQFFAGDYDSFRVTVGEYKNCYSHQNDKAKKSNEKTHKTVCLLVALCDNNTQKIDEYRKEIEPWNNSKATKGYIDFLKGLAANKLGDKEESTYRFMSVKENCPKTFLAERAEKYLEVR